MGRLELIPLGGIGEFGMNCMAIRYADEMIIIDAGMGFPDESAYGVDVAIPIVSAGFAQRRKTILNNSAQRAKRLTIAY